MAIKHLSHIAIPDPHLTVVVNSNGMDKQISLSLLMESIELHYQEEINNLRSQIKSQQDKLNRMEKKAMTQSRKSTRGAI